MADRAGGLPLVAARVKTGLRFGEAAGLRVGDLGLGGGRLRVETSLVEVVGQLEETTPKSHRARTVPVPRFLREQLAALGRRSGSRGPALHDEEREIAAE